MNLMAVVKIMVTFMEHEQLVTLFMANRQMADICPHGFTSPLAEV